MRTSVALMPLPDAALAHNVALVIEGVTQAGAIHLKQWEQI